MGSGSYEKTLKKLEELESTSLPESIKLYVRLTRLQLEAGSQIKSKEAHLSQKEIDERVGLGVIALKFDELRLDWVKVEKLFKQALSLIGEYSPSVDAEYAVPLRQIVKSWYNKQSFPHDGMDEELVTVAVHSAVKPFLSGWAQELLPMVKQERWRRGYCPVCGGTPNFAYLDTDSGARWLCCPRCDAEWLFQRLECPFCGNIKQKELAFFHDMASITNEELVLKAGEWVGKARQPDYSIEKNDPDANYYTGKGVHIIQIKNADIVGNAEKYLSLIQVRRREHPKGCPPKKESAHCDQKHHEDELHHAPPAR